MKSTVQLSVNLAAGLARKAKVAICEADTLRRKRGYDSYVEFTNSRTRFGEWFAVQMGDKPKGLSFEEWEDRTYIKGYEPYGLGLCRALIKMGHALPPDEKVTLTIDDFDALVRLL